MSLAERVLSQKISEALSTMKHEHEIAEMRKLSKMSTLENELGRQNILEATGNYGNLAKFTPAVDRQDLEQHARTRRLDHVLGVVCGGRPPRGGCVRGIRGI